MKHCIFDLDGTLLDTLTDLHAAVNHALRANYMPERSLDEVRLMVGNGVRKLMIRAVPDGDGNPFFEKAFTDFRAYYSEHSFDNTKPYDGIMALLSELKGRGVRMAVVSNKMDAATKPLVKRFFGDYIDVAIGENEAEGIKRKPASDMVLKAIEELGVKADDCVYVGDSDVDIQTANNSKISCISVLWGFRDRDFLASMGAQCFVESPLDILALLK